jgi:FOG: Ankyrin repeat
MTLVERHYFMLHSMAIQSSLELYYLIAELIQTDKIAMVNAAELHCREGPYKNCLTLLSGDGVYPDQQDNNDRTLPSLAAERGHAEVVKTLISNGQVDPDRQNSNGQKPLFYAAWLGHTEIVKLWYLMA